MTYCVDLQHPHLQPLRCRHVFQREQCLTNHVLHRKYTNCSSSHNFQFVILKSAKDLMAILDYFDLSLHIDFPTHSHSFTLYLICSVGIVNFCIRVWDFLRSTNLSNCHLPFLVFLLTSVTIFWRLYTKFTIYFNLFFSSFAPLEPYASQIPCQLSNFTLSNTSVVEQLIMNSNSSSFQLDSISTSLL